MKPISLTLLLTFSLLLLNQSNSLPPTTSSPRRMSSAASTTAKAAAAASATTTAASSTNTSIRIASYNILSSKLASPTHFTSCNPDHLSFTNRLPKILSKLEDELTPSTIYCLQEVSYDFAGPLHTFFANKGYHFITGLYGKKFNGYMGIGLAYPVDQYETISVDVERLSDARIDGWPRPPDDSDEEESLTTKLSNLVSKAWNSLPSFTSSSSEKPPIDPWNMSENRFNVCLTACLKERSSGKAFCIGNYHMPCAFYAPPVMNIHAEMVARHVQTMAKNVAGEEEEEQCVEGSGGVPYILAGDFNILPDSPHYRMLTTGELEREDETYPPAKYGVEWSFEGVVGMRSAYAVLEGKEPDFTNYAKIKEDDPFIGTLDYIFLSDEWKVSSVKKIVHRDEANGPYPNEEEPSDHVLIAADLEL